MRTLLFFSISKLETTCPLSFSHYALLLASKSLILENQRVGPVNVDLVLIRKIFNWDYCFGRKLEVALRSQESTLRLSLPLLDLQETLKWTSKRITLLKATYLVLILQSHILTCTCTQFTINLSRITF